MSAFSRPILFLLGGLLFLTISMAVLNTLVPLWLTHASLSTWQVGLVSSAFFTGNLAGTLITGAMIARWGFNRSYYYASLLFAVATVGLLFDLSTWNWMLWRFVAGMACAMIWVIVESALLCSGTIKTRGMLLAAYMVTYYVGTVVGQLMLSQVPTALLHVIPWVCVLMLIAILPLLCTRLPAPEAKTRTLSPWSMFKRQNARLGINGCIISGITLGTLYGLLPIYLAHAGKNDASVGYWMALLVSAGIIGQIPVGRLAERYGRLMVLRVQVFVIIIGCIAMLNHYAMVPSLFMLGAACFTLYPVAMAWACETVQAAELVTMNQTLLLSYTVGSLLGPAITAMLMQHFSDSLLFVVIAGAALVYLMMLLKKRDRHHTPVATA